MEQQQIGGDDFSVADLNEVSGAKLVPLRFHELSIAEYAGRSGVDLPVLPVSFLRGGKRT